MIQITKFLLGIIFILIIFTILSISHVDLSNYYINTTSGGRNGNYDLPWATDGNTASPSKKHVHGGSSSRAVTTKIVAVTDIQYSQIALEWYQKLSNLGYTTHVIVAADDKSLAFFQQQQHQQNEQYQTRTNTNTTTQTSTFPNTNNIIRVEPLIDPTSSDWPIAAGQPRQLRLRIFATRWVYIIGQLKNGHHILLTDADNIFLRYMPMSIMETSNYDVYHSYCADYPVRFVSMGFVVCGGMTWLRSSKESIRYVESILQQCGWDGMDNDDGAELYGNPANISRANTIATPAEYYPPVLPMKAKAAKCDDQQVINSKFFSNTLNYTWDTNENTLGKPKVEDGFWKSEASGQSLVTGHRFKLWSVDTCYRGSVDGSKEGRCPDSKLNWVAMPLNTIDASKKLSSAEDRELRVKQWYRFCRHETK